MLPELVETSKKGFSQLHGTISGYNQKLTTAQKLRRQAAEANLSDKAESLICKSISRQKQPGIKPFELECKQATADEDSPDQVNVDQKEGQRLIS